jgi:hypothetical protein
MTRVLGRASSEWSVDIAVGNRVRLAATAVLNGSSKEAGFTPPRLTDGG